MDSNPQASSEPTQSKMVLDIGNSCDTGDMRKINEDRVLVKKCLYNDEEWGLFTVADGMGGMSRGGEASQIIIDVLSDWWENTLPVLQGLVEPDLVIDSLDKAIEAANTQVVAIQSGKMIGSTLSLLFMIGRKYTTRHVGDSRIYMLNREYGIRQLTTDHSYVAEQVKQGNLTQNEARIHPKRNAITKCIGMKNMPVLCKQQGTCKIGDILLLCSDGFYGLVSDAAILDTVFDSPPFMEEKIIALRNRITKGKAHDNVSIILVYPTDADETEIAE